jgi:hypothetical protein
VTTCYDAPTGKVLWSEVARPFTVF